MTLNIPSHLPVNVTEMLQQSCQLLQFWSRISQIWYVILQVFKIHPQTKLMTAATCGALWTLNQRVVGSNPGEGTARYL
jgi:hypothetical protein